MLKLWAPLLFSVALVAGEPQLQREGVHWVQYITEPLPLAARGKLVVQTRGPIRVQGGAANSQVVLKLRTKVRSEAQARTLFRRAMLSVQEGPLRTVRVNWGAAKTHNPAVSAELQFATRSDLVTVHLQTQGGDIEVGDIAGEVHARSGGGSIRVDGVKGDLTARTAGGDVRLGVIDGSVRCFSGGGLIEAHKIKGESWFETAGGDIRVASVGGPLHASTAGGNIQVGDAGSWVTAKTSGGRIEVQHARGAVIAGNSSGSIHVGSAQGVRCESNGGSIRLRGSEGALRAVTDDGSILAELVADRLQDSTLATSAGDIIVYIPSKLALTVKALREEGGSGRIVSDFSEIYVRRTEGQHDHAALSAEGTLNGGGPVLKLTSTQGTIYLRRQK